MAGYTRQSIADIINGLDVTAPPINAEFNRMQEAFDASTGHSHDGLVGNAPPVPLSTSVSGYLASVNGGTGGLNNTTATVVPGVNNDATQGYAAGSLWLNTTTDRVYHCASNGTGAAVWNEAAQITAGGVFFPATNDTVDLGTTTKRFRDAYLSGVLKVAGDITVAGTITSVGNAIAPTFVGNLTGNVTGDTVGDVTGNLTGNVAAASGTSILNNLTVNGTADFTNTTLANISGPSFDTDAANKLYVDTAISDLIETAPGTLDTLNELAAALGDDPNFATTISNEVATKLPKDGGTMSGSITMSGNKVTGLGSPTISTDAVPLQYVTTLFGSTSDAASSAASALASKDNILGVESTVTTLAGEADVDAATALEHSGIATDKATEASNSASTATSQADIATTKAASTAADRVATNQDTVDTAADLAATNQDTVDTAADRVATNQDAIDTAEDLAATTQYVIDTAALESAASASASNASTSESNASTSETNAAASEAGAAAASVNAAIIYSIALG